MRHCTACRPACRLSPPSSTRDEIHQSRRPIPAPGRAAARSRIGLPAGGIGDRRDPAVAGRPRDRHCHHQRFLSGDRLGVVGDARHHRHGAGQDCAQRPQQDHPTVRHGRCPGDPCNRRPACPRRRSLDRARPDDGPRRTGASAQRPRRRPNRHCPAPRRAEPMRTIHSRIPSASRCEPGAGRQPAPAVERRDHRTARQARGTRSPSGRKSRRAGYRQRHDRQDRRGDSIAAAAGRYARATRCERPRGQRSCTCRKRRI